MTLSGRYKTVLRSAVVTFLVLSCVASAVYFMGKAYSAMEMTANGKEVDFLDISEKGITFFGSTYEFDISLSADKIKNAADFFSGGIIKLLAILKNGCGELSYLIGYFK